ncbi:MAG: glycosyltransferase family 2 protein [Chitinophagaceae bacterium]|nr:MAG: glycosyltransferase family 2 protein [Chitinophagaceae bacterium]
MSAFVSIVILNWNGRSFLEEFLPSVVATTYRHREIVLADNASSDDSIQFVQATYPEIRIIRLAKNFGFTKGYNEALKQVQADYYILLNSDVEVEPGWVEPMVALLEASPVIGICQPKLLQHTNRDLFEYAGAAGGWIDKLGYPFARGRIFDYCERDNGQYNEAQPIFWASGAAMFVRASLYHRLGGFEEYFFAHQEEIDFCWRAQHAGFEVYACPASVVYHVGGGTLPKGNSRKVFLNFRNNLIMLAKNLPVAEAILKISCRFWLDAISAWKSLFAGQGKYFVAVVEAHVAFFFWLFIKRKHSLFPEKRNAKLHGYLHRSVVWAHFVEGKKKFMEIVQKKSDIFN